MSGGENRVVVIRHHHHQNYPDQSPASRPPPQYGTFQGVANYPPLQSQPPIGFPQPSPPPGLSFTPPQYYAHGYQAAPGHPSRPPGLYFDKWKFLSDMSLARQKLSQLCSSVKDRTQVDRELELLRRGKVLRIFKLNTGQDDHAIMFLDDYLNKIEQVVERLKDKERGDVEVFEWFKTHVIESKQEPGFSLITWGKSEGPTHLPFN